MFQKELMLIKQVCQKNVCLAIICFLKMLELNLNHMFEINATMASGLENIVKLSAKGATFRCLRRLNNSVLEVKVSYK